MSKVVDELLHRRSDLAERQAFIRAEIAKIDQDLAAVDRVLGLLDPAYQTNTAKKRASPSSGTGLSRGELSECILEVLRDHDSVSAAECAELIAAMKAIPATTLPRLKTNVGTALAYLATRDRVRRVSDGEGRSVHWQIAR